MIILARFKCPFIKKSFVFSEILSLFSKNAILRRLVLQNCRAGRRNFATSPDGSALLQFCNFSAGSTFASECPPTALFAQPFLPIPTRLAPAAAANWMAVCKSVQIQLKRPEPSTNFVLL